MAMWAELKDSTGDGQVLGLATAELGGSGRNGCDWSLMKVETIATEEHSHPQGQREAWKKGEE